MKRHFKRILVTGGAGFIGSCFIRQRLLRLSDEEERVVNLDLLTYASNLNALKEVVQDRRYCLIQGDVRDESLVETICLEEQIELIVHFAAESHVDRSIETPSLFYQTNVEGTLSLLNVMRRHPAIHLHHISTDEVFGSLPPQGAFSECSPYRPNSPYAASKAASDHFVRAYAHTYSLSTTLSHCTNNYGPHQHEEKFIPTIIEGCLHHRPIPIYGSGTQVRDWIFVEDHVQAIELILKEGRRGETYAIGGGCEKQNIELVQEIMEQMAKKLDVPLEEYQALITFVKDRPGHDVRYAIDFTKMKNGLGWSPRWDFHAGISQTIDAYLISREVVS